MDLPGLNSAETRDNADDVDSTFGSEYESSTLSLSEEVKDYRMIEGRSYHSINKFTGNTKYWGCNDEKQNHRQAIIHEMLWWIHGEELHLAPLPDNAKKVLDVGTGTGDWAIDFADMHSDILVTGTDISPIQPDWVPPNLAFAVENISDWSFTNKFDFVHCRLLNGCIPDWFTYFRDVYRTLEPGGWFESHEISPHISSDDGSVAQDSAMAKFGRLFEKGGESLGQPFDIVEKHVQKDAMKAAGFVNIQEKSYKIPIGEWPKEEKDRDIGRAMQYALYTDLEGTILFMALELGWSKSERLEFVLDFRRELRELRSGHVHGWSLGRIVYGQKQEHETA